ncbi:hypothetical protein [Cryptosporangium sp. NPDC051539]|uniref:hypothetical protein n=1 Tax=Cryptosporangium sp. NPDC051539 TaxID=3363962 RepID=UPI00379F78F0
MAILLGWLFVRSGSVWVTSLAHGCSNLVCGVGGEILLIENGGLGPVALDVLLMIPMALAAAAILATGQFSGGARLAHRAYRREVAGKDG